MSALALNHRLPIGPVEIIENGLNQFDRFDASVEKIIEAFQERLLSSEAQKIIVLAAQKFGNDGAIGAFRILKRQFIRSDWWCRDRIFPKDQIALIRSLAEVQSVDFKTAVYVLKQLKFYQETERESRESSEDSFNERGESVWIKCEVTKPMFLEPISILGQRYGRDAAMEVALEASNHYRMGNSSWKSCIVDHFRGSYGDALAKKIESDVNYSKFQLFLDAILGDDPFEDHGHQAPRLL